MGEEDDIKVFLLHAARDEEWSVVQDVAQRYGRIADAVLLAAECGNAELVRTQLQRAEPVELMGAACRGGQLEVIQLLLDSGVPANGRLPSGTSFLMRVSAWGHVQAVRLLIERRADVNAAEDDDGFTSLMAAASDGCDALFPP